MGQHMQVDWSLVPDPRQHMVLEAQPALPQLATDRYIGIGSRIGPEAQLALSQQGTAPTRQTCTHI